jgi:hypothetical protein
MLLAFEQELWARDQEEVLLHAQAQQHPQQQHQQHPDPQQHQHHEKEEENTQSPAGPAHELVYAANSDGEDFQWESMEEEEEEEEDEEEEEQVQAKPNSTAVPLLPWERLERLICHVVTSNLNYELLQNGESWVALGCSACVLELVPVLRAHTYLSLLPLLPWYVFLLRDRLCSRPNTLARLLPRCVHVLSEEVSSVGGTRSLGAVVSARTLLSMLSALTDSAAPVARSRVSLFSSADCRELASQIQAALPQLVYVLERTTHELQQRRQGSGGAVALHAHPQTVSVPPELDAAARVLHFYLRVAGHAQQESAAAALVSSGAWRQLLSGLLLVCSSVRPSSSPADGTHLTAALHQLSCTVLLGVLCAPKLAAYVARVPRFTEVVLACSASLAIGMQLAEALHARTASGSARRPPRKEESAQASDPPPLLAALLERRELCRGTKLLADGRTLGSLLEQLSIVASGASGTSALQRSLPVTLTRLRAEAAHLEEEHQVSAREQVHTTAERPTAAAADSTRRAEGGEGVAEGGQSRGGDEHREDDDEEDELRPSLRLARALRQFVLQGAKKPGKGD